ncbi:MAG: glycosyltransferase family 2 protein [Anaerolineae bacterium]|nr:glycosyltransferase family 2 protein [Anaerolineae bacterium]
MPPDLAIVIVSWNVRALLLDCLESVHADLAGSGLDAQVYVVDNASADGTPHAVRERFPQVRLLESGRNLGFAAGNNVALRALGFQDRPAPNPDGPRAVFLLNPDTLVQPGAIRALVDALFDLPRAGLVAAQLQYGDGAFQHSGFRFPGLWQLVFDLYPLPNRLRARLAESALNGRYPRRLYEAGAPFPVEHTLGATMMARREALETAGLFDEAYFMYVEEIDWHRRIRRAGWEIYVVPAAHVVHLEGRSTRQVRPESQFNLWSSRFRYFAKAYSPLKLALARLLVRGGMRWATVKARRAARRGDIDPAARDALIAAYRRIAAL